MSGLEYELHEARKRLEQGFQEMSHSMALWRDRMHREVERLEAVEVDDREAEGGGFEELPEGAPAGYRTVLERIGRGELNMRDVISGEVADRDARAVHVWLEPRLVMVQRAWRLMEQGIALDEAAGRAEAEMRREQGSARRGGR